MRITTDELRGISERLLAHLERNGIESVEVSEDYYWDVPTGSRYDPYKQPPELSLGQLSEDWRELHRILQGESEPISYALVWLASILRAVGEKVVS